MRILYIPVTKKIKEKNFQNYFKCFLYDIYTVLNNFKFSKKILGMHWGTFVLSLEPIMEPPARFKKNAEKYGFKKDDALIFKIGQISPLKDIIY